MSIDKTQLESAVPFKYMDSVTEKSKLDDLVIDHKFLEKLRLGPQQWYDLELPTRHGDVINLRMRILTVREYMDVESEALKWIGAKTQLEQNSSLFAKEKAILTLERALSSHRMMSDSSYQINRATLEALSLETISFLMKAYGDLCYKYDISVDDVSDEEIMMMVDQLEKKSDLVSNLSRSHLEKVVVTLLKKCSEMSTQMANLLTGS